jgi:hypothetical protein
VVTPVTIVFRTKEWLSLPQLVDAWGLELAKVGEEPNRSQKALEHVLLEDIINGRLDQTGPLQDGRMLGLRLEFGGRAYFVEGHEIRTLMADPLFSLHRIVIMKEAVLGFAKRREIPPPSWWTDGTSVSTDAGVTTRGTHSIGAMGAAFEKACQTLRNGGRLIAKDVIAKRIIALAQEGERVISPLRIMG